METSLNKTFLSPYVLRQRPVLRFGVKIQVQERGVSYGAPSYMQKDTDEAAQLIFNVIAIEKKKPVAPSQREAHSRYLYDVLQQPQTKLERIRDEQDKLVAVGLFQPDSEIASDTLREKCGFISDLYVAPEAQGKKLGTQIIENLCNYARKKGFTKVFLKTDSEKTHCFYTKRGFQPIHQVYNKTYWVKSFDGKDIAPDALRTLQLRIDIWETMYRFIYRPLNVILNAFRYPDPLYRDF